MKEVCKLLWGLRFFRLWLWKEQTGRIEQARAYFDVIESLVEECCFL
jgi:hypothetical protein